MAKQASRAQSDIFQSPTVQNTEIFPFKKLESVHFSILTNMINLKIVVSYLVSID